MEGWKIMKKLVAVLFFCGALFAALPGWAQTQITSGVIQGTVVDPSGALIPDAQVEAQNLETNLVRTLNTDENGRFVFLQLPSGSYTVTVRQQGFATLVQENLILTVGQAITLTLTMKVAAAAETITVTATPTVDVVKTEVSNTLNQSTIDTTPVLGRKFEDLLTLTPGVSIVQGPDGDEITFNGQRGVNNNFSLDGDHQVGHQRRARQHLPFPAA
jgi:hypothetical protein